jgi:hypothetical protein
MIFLFSFDTKICEWENKKLVKVGLEEMGCVQDGNQKHTHTRDSIVCD